MTNILIADDHDLVRDTIAAYLETVDGFNVFTAHDLATALEVMSGLDSIDLLIPATKVALMSGVANRDVANEAMKRHARGFIPKSLSAVSFINAIKFILLGEKYLPFDLVSSAPAGKNHGDFTNVSAREMQTLEQLCIGLSNKEIARNLDIQEVTVKLHVKNIFSKLGVSNRTQAALFAKERHLF